MLDFAATIYDREFRLLAQAPSLPAFMGTMDFCVRAAVERVGGEEALEPGDIVLINEPYATGSHPQDAAMVMPVYLPGGEPIGYTAIKAHWLDIGAIAPYCTNTTDVFQEGVVFPGVKLFVRGQLVKDVYRMVIANTRMPVHVAGDVNAEVVGLRTGAAALVRLVERYGLARFEECVERMYDHGEAVVRSYLERIPDGRYVAQGQMDSDGVSDDPVPFEVAVEVDGSTVRLDYTNAPDATRGAGQLPPADDRLHLPGRHDDAREQRRGAERGALPADRGRDPTRLDVPSPRARAVLPLRLVGDAGRRHRAPSARRSRAGARACGLAPVTSAVSSGGASVRRRVSSGATGRRTRWARAPVPEATAARA